MYKSLLLLSFSVGLISPFRGILSSDATNLSVEINQAGYVQVDEYQLEENSSDLEPPNISISELFEKASAAYHTEDYFEAEVLLQRILERNPDAETKALVYESLGEVLTRQDKLEEAYEAYQQAIEVEPNRLTAHAGVGIVLSEMGQAREAYLHLNQVKKLLPRKLESLEELTYYSVLSSGFRQINEFPASIEVIRQAITLNPYIANAAPFNSSPRLKPGDFVSLVISP